MSLIDRTVNRALADAATITAQDAATLTEITVRRLPGSPHWELLIDGTPACATSASDGIAIAALDAVRLNGGRATIIYQDFNSMTERMNRAKLGQETANNVSLGWKVWVRGDGQTLIPCAPSDAYATLFTVEKIDWNPTDNVYTWIGLGEHTAPQEPHAIVHVVKPGE